MVIMTTQITSDLHPKSVVSVIQIIGSHLRVIIILARQRQMVNMTNE